MRRNFLNLAMQPIEGIHRGTGPVSLSEIWSSGDFRGNWDFVVRVVVPAGSTIGYHQHGENEEMYIVLKGAGMMTMDGETFRIEAGDMMLNPPGGKHGLVNDSDDDIDLLIIQVSCP